MAPVSPTTERPWPKQADVRHPGVYGLAGSALPVVDGRPPVSRPARRLENLPKKAIRTMGDVRSAGPNDSITGGEQTVVVGQVHDPTDQSTEVTIPHSSRTATRVTHEGS